MTSWNRFSNPPTGSIQDSFVNTSVVKTSRESLVVVSLHSFRSSVHDGKIHINSYAFSAATVDLPSPMSCTAAVPIAGSSFNTLELNYTECGRHTKWRSFVVRASFLFRSHQQHQQKYKHHDSRCYPCCCYLNYYYHQSHILFYYATDSNT